MTVTLTANYKEFVSAECAEKIEELLEENYALDDMLEFIDERNETNFVLFYEEYVRVGEAIGYDAVDALIEEMGCVADIEDCDDRYMGMYDSTADFAQETVESCYGDIPSIVVVDWEATWDSSLRYDYTACEVGYRQVYIFRDF